MTLLAAMTLAVYCKWSRNQSVFSWVLAKHNMSEADHFQQNSPLRSHCQNKDKPSHVPVIVPRAMSTQPTQSILNFLCRACALAT